MQYAFKYSLEEEQKKRELPVRAILQDVPTRWGSTRSSTGSFLDKEEKGMEAEVNRASEVFRDQHKNMETINAALRKIKYRGEQKLTQYLLTEEDMTRISTVNRFLTKLDIFSTTLGGDQYVTSSVLLPVIAAQAQAPRQSVCSAEWVSCRTRGGSACLVRESVTMQLFLKDNLEL